MYVSTEIIRSNKNTEVPSSFVMDSYLVPPFEWAKPKQTCSCQLPSPYSTAAAAWGHQTTQRGVNQYVPLQVLCSHCTTCKRNTRKCWTTRNYSQMCWNIHWIAAWTENLLLKIVSGDKSSNMTTRGPVPVILNRQVDFSSSVNDTPAMTHHSPLFLEVWFKAGVLVTLSTLDPVGCGPTHIVLHCPN